MTYILRHPASLSSARCLLHEHDGVEEHGQADLQTRVHHVDLCNAAVHLRHSYFGHVPHDVAPELLVRGVSARADLCVWRRFR
jgi:hypothetical protein